MAAVAYWWPRPEKGAGNVELGALPRGVNRQALNLLVITLDTTRADRLGAYGFNGIETPTIDRLAAEGVLFEQATTAAPLTLPSHSSIFTSLYPPDHGVRDNGGVFFILVPQRWYSGRQKKNPPTMRAIGAVVYSTEKGMDQTF